MKTYRLVIITENQNHLHKAEKVAHLIKSDLKLQTDPEIRKYEKFANSYRIKFSEKFPSGADAISGAIELTDRLASPWLTYFDRTTGDIELIFNKSTFSRYGRQEFNVISWANLETE